MSVALTRSPKPRLSWFDRLVCAVAPRFGLRRLQAKNAVAITVRHFDAASGGRRTFGWRKSGSSADAANGPAIATLRSISRDLRRNNGWARRGIQVIAHSTVGYGIEPSAEASTQIARRANDIWKSWAGRVTCDVNGRLPFTGMQRLAMEAIAESGEVLIVRKVPPPSLGLSIPLQLRIVEPDLLDSSRDGVRGEIRTVDGIEYDRDGRRLAYWLFPRHPGGQLAFDRGIQSIRVPAEDVLHVYRVERPGQSRGVPWLASAIARLQDFDDFEDAELMRQKIAACFGAFVTDYHGDPVPTGDATEDDSIETLEPGQIEYLPPGRQISFATPPPVTEQGFTERNLRRIAATLGVTYEDLTGDYSRVNFSSARMARLSHYQHVYDWQWNMLIPQLCDGVWRWVMDLAIRSGRLGRLQDPPTAEWSPPPIPMLEPEKEGLAYQRMMRNGVMTFEQMCRERGQDPERQLEQIKEWNAKYDDAEVVLDCDPRRTTNTGQAQASSPMIATDGEAGQAQADDDDDPEE